MIIQVGIWDNNLKRGWNMFDLFTKVLYTSLVNNKKSQHIRQKPNIVRQLLSSEIITTDRVKSKDNIVNLFVKDLN